MNSRPLPATDDRWLSVTRPTAVTKWWRTCIPWQFVRFCAVNLKMVRLISRNHH